jgi:molybdopterin biosynthesis enzyme
MSGKKAEKPLELKASVSMRIFPAKGRRTFIMVKLKSGKSELIAEPVPTGLSGAITTLERADGFVEIPEDVQFIDAGESVTVKLFTALSPLRPIWPSTE